MSRPLRSRNRLSARISVRYVMDGVPRVPGEMHRGTAKTAGTPRVINEPL